MSVDDLKSLKDLLDGLARGQLRLEDKMDDLTNRVERMDKNFNGDGGPSNRGWAGVIDDLKNQVNGLMARAAYAMTWINAVGMLALAWVWAHATGNGK